jgi:ribonuclease HII
MNKTASRIKKNLRYEQSLWSQSQLVVGIDEVGRGCLAGPVVVAACTLFPGKTSAKIKDSKVLNEQELQEAAAWLYQNSWYSIATISAAIIDRINIYQATLLGMKRAYWQLQPLLPQQPQLLLVDAMPLVIPTAEPLETISLIKGESASISIAGASIIAKVYRDNLMKELHKVIPGYGFDVHKGYGTPQHRAAISQHGLSLIHRTSFNSKAYDDKQLSLW